MSVSTEPRAAPAVGHLTIRDLPQHVQSLDGLRAMAIVGVMAFHLGLLGGGFLGVNLFFVLSGFLITTLLVKAISRTGGPRYRKFIYRRVLRLVPALAVMLSVVALVVYLTPVSMYTKATIRQLPFAATYTWNLVAGFIPPKAGLLSHTWSLGLEEQFYLLWPFVLTVILVRVASPKHRVLVVGAMAVAFAVLRGAAVLVLHKNAITLQGDTLLLGCMAGLAFCYWPSAERVLASRRVLGPLTFSWLVCLVLVVVGRESNPLLSAAGYPLLSLLFAVTLLRLVLVPGGIASRALGSRLPASLGRISYGMYLWHAPVFLVMAGLRFPVPAIALLGSLVTVAIAATSYRLVECPFLRRKQIVS